MLVPVMERHAETSGSPLWFGPDDERAFGWLHRPADGQTRGAVLLCPPLGYEFICAYRAYRLLAELLAAAGLAVLRFDYHGTGDATGDSDDPDRVGAYVRTIGHARDEIARHTDAPVSAVAMRAGALLVCAAAVVEPFDRLVLWDPSTSGRGFIKEMKLLRMIGMGIPDETRTDGSFESAGVDYSAETVAALKRLDIANLKGRLATEILLATRPTREPPAKTLAVLEGGTDKVERLTATGQEQLIDVVSAHSSVPTETVEAIVNWLADHVSDRSPYPVTGAADDGHRSIVGRAEDGQAIVEEARFVGEFGLFVMTTAAEDGGRGPWIIGLNNSIDHHIGPNRMWVELARDLARRGGRCARVDLSGIGDSGVRAGQAAHHTYAREHYEDVTIIASTLQRDDPHEVVLTGMCSGGYLAVDVGAVFGVRAVYPINPELDFVPEDLLADETAIRAAPPAHRWTRVLSGSDLAARLNTKIPPFVWTLIDRLGIRASPARGLHRLVERGVDTTVIFGDDEVLAKFQRRARADLRALEGSPRFHMSIIAGMDHALMRTRERKVLYAQLLQEIVSTHIPPSHAE
jgi:alpha-beta hydrolase superfamily lysophospholipase